eukprot:Partr_v1_DN25623_c0_g1_i1_m4460 putative Catalyzes conversion of folates to polyglutamate derivatives allowing concentration of folate compounds in the cell and the intracellular retention of these cofactors, which are important substrates for most of the folate-dependent enzymes that are involved in one-carbon transfer reactions involved in purine, pyrimidine and amino acid synthesis (By similarity)
MPTVQVTVRTTFSRCVSRVSVNKCDVAVIEVGMGGRFDATNVSGTRKLLSVLTSISFDHCDFLGDDIESIASHKAGIIRPGVPVVLGLQDHSATLSVVEAECAKVGAGHMAVIQRDSSPIDGFEDIVSCKTRAFADNARLAISSVLELSHNLPKDVAYWKIRNALTLLTSEVIMEGLLKLKWPGRYERFDNLARSPVYVDGAHNLDSIRNLKRQLDVDFSSDVKRIFIFGCTSSRNFSELLDVLVVPEHGDILISCGFSSPDGMPWISCYPPEKICAISCADISGAFEIANRQIEGNCIIIVCGSLYLVSDFYRYMLPQFD